VSATVTTRVHFGVEKRGRKRLREGADPHVEREEIRGRVPRVARLMALAIKFDRLLSEGAVETQAELAELGRVTRARITQIMNLLHLAPDLQEAVLSLPPVEEGRDPVTERDLRAVVREVEWGRQRALWEGLKRQDVARSRGGST
jgi:hypothetical protein